ncbi:MAG: hypothetical protein AAGM38_00630 [Pseudomonadota bacterium]
MRLLFGALLAFGLAGAAQAQDLCTDPQRSCGRLVEPNCLSRMAAGAIDTSDTGCQGQVATYRECLKTVSSVCGDDAGASVQRSIEVAPSVEATIIVQEASTLEGCVVAGTLPEFGHYRISDKTSFRRPDGQIWFFVTHHKYQGNSSIRVNLPFTPQGWAACRGEKPTCVFRDEAEGAYRITVFESKSDYAQVTITRLEN